MKKETASQIRYKRLSKLVNACLEKYSEEEMMEAFSNITGEDYVKSKDSEEMVSELVMAGYCIFRPDNTNQSDQLKEYAEKYVFPYYNEQQTAILF